MKRIQIPRRRERIRGRAGRRRERKRTEQILRAAESRLAHGRLDEKTHRMLEHAAEKETDLSILNRIGDLLARADRIEPGIALFERVGRAYADDGFWAKAIAIYKKILRYDQRRADIRNRLAFLYQRSGLPTRS